MKLVKDLNNAILVSKKIQDEAYSIYKPPDLGGVPCTDKVIPFSVVKNTRGYIEKVTDQINGTYENGYYDACAVMIRRLIETLIIEMFEHNRIDSKIKNQNGDFFYLNNLIDIALREKKWNLSRTTKNGLKKLKNIGDFSAHSRRYNAHRPDIDNISTSLRVIIQEFIYIANL